MPGIAHVITGLGVGGAERALHALLCGGLQNDYQNSVVTLRDEGHYGPALIKSGVPVTALKMWPFAPSPLKLMRLSKSLITPPKAIVQGWMYHGNLAATLALPGKPHKPKLVWNIRTSLDAGLHGQLKRKVLVAASARLSQRAAAIIYNSSASRNQHEAAGLNTQRSLVIPNGFDLSLWKPDPADRQNVRAAWGLHDDDFAIGFVGRNVTEKDVPNFLQAITQLMTQDERVHVVMIGRGLAQSLAALPSLLAARIHLLGERHDVPMLMRGLDVLCLSSRREAFPNVVGEAMATAVPCVATDVGDVRHIVGDTGWVVPAQNAAALSLALASARNTPTSEMINRGQAARARIQALFSLTAMVSSYRSLYDALLQEP
jgi:glycosyltransferase involved in cell wall biosynthesis